MRVIWQVLLILMVVVLLARADPASPALSKTEKDAGKRLYIRRCAKCHRLYQPADYSPDEWRLWMNKMTRKAKLTPEQQKLLSRYLDGDRADNGVRKTALPAGLQVRGCVVFDQPQQVK